jgi:hypothetical protein
MRRKIGPIPLPRAASPRPLHAAAVRAGLPTAAALALALAGLGCSGEPTNIASDGVVVSKIEPKNDPKVEPSTSSSAGSIDPTPVPLPGEPAIVVPPPPPPRPRPKPAIAPSTEHPKLGGKPMDPTI